MVWYLVEGNRTIQMRLSGGLSLDSGSTESTLLQIDSSAAPPSGWSSILVWYLVEGNRTIQMRQSGRLSLDFGSTESTPLQIDSSADADTRFLDFQD